MSDSPSPPARKKSSGGGLQMPRNPSEELRRITMEQMNQPPGSGGAGPDETALATESVPPTPLEDNSSSSAQMRNRADTQMLEQAAEQVSKPASAEASTQARTSSSNRASTPSSEQAVKIGDSIEECVREALMQRRTHPGGTKASVDMSPELSRRLKQYCLDHGDVSIRQLMIEIAVAFLEKEGY